MTTPADDCGVRGGCQACPLFAANVCGDPAPEPCAPAGYRLVNGRGETVRTYPDPAEVFPNWARFEVNAGGVVVDRQAPDWAALVDAYLTRALAEALGVDPDAPDVDPAEPKPEGVGCCGGGCCA